MEDVVLAGLTGAGMLASIGVSWGMMDSKMKGLEKELDELSKECVRRDYMHAVTEPLQENIREIQSDIKEILKAVRNNG